MSAILIVTLLCQIALSIKYLTVSKLENITKFEILLNVSEKFIKFLFGI